MHPFPRTLLDKRRDRCPGSDKAGNEKDPEITRADTTRRGKEGQDASVTKQEVVKRNSLKEAGRPKDLDILLLSAPVIIINLIESILVIKEIIPQP